MKSIVLVPLALTACTGNATPEAPRGSSGAAILREVVFEGMCDASGAVSLSSGRMVAADDEDNVLRLYDADHGGAALASVDVSAALGLPLKGKKRPRPAEADFEAATLLGDRAYWLSSHGRNKKGKLAAERAQFFATTVPTADGDLSVVGRHDTLLDDLVADPRYAVFGLASASELAPKDTGGLNIEGLTATPEGHLLIGFRNPLPENRALIAPLLNPAELIDSATAARFGDPMLLDLGGLGIRSLSWWRGRYLVVAGPTDTGPGSRLYTWDGHNPPVPVDLDLAAYNPEGFFSPEDRDDIMLLSDDGTRLIDDVPCKDTELPDRRRFRGVWVRLPS